MSPQDPHELWRLCDEALAHPAGEREAFLETACGTDADLRRAVEALLAESPSAAGFLDTPAWEPARQPLTAGTHLGP